MHTKIILTLFFLLSVNLYLHATTRKWDYGANTPTLEQAQELAQKGDSEAQWRLGCHYQVPNGLYIRNEGNFDMSSKNDAEAFKWFSKAAANGYCEAILSLANCYEEGVGTSYDIQKALQLYEAAAALGNDGCAEYFIAGIYLKNSSNNLADSTNPRELIDSISASPNQNFKEKAVFWLKKASEKNHIGAKIALGHRYMRGEGIQKNQIMAIQILSSNAPLELAEYYKDGKFLPKDDKKVFQCYQNAAASVDHMATGMFELGNCYSKGIGVTKNQEEAVKWYIKTVESAGSWVGPSFPRPEAARILGGHYQQGVGVIKNDLEAYAYFTLANRADDSCADILKIYEEQLLNQTELEAGKIRADDLEKQIENGKILPAQRGYEKKSTRPKQTFDN